MTKKPAPKPVHFQHQPQQNDRRGDGRDKQSKFEKYFNTTWRPAMAWLYGFIILFDFVIGPSIWMCWQMVHGVTVLVQWTSLTLSNGGLFHIAMGAIVGVTAWTRGKEKASPWAMLPQLNTGVQESADNRPYIDPEGRFR